MKLHEWKTRIQSGEHLLGTMVTTFASADLPKILKACGFDFFIIQSPIRRKLLCDIVCFRYHLLQYFGIISRNI